MALIFLGVPIVFTISSFKFTKSNCRDFIASDAWPQFIRPQSTGLSRLGALLESYYKLQPKPKTVPKIKDSLQVIWSALSENSIDNSAKDYRKRLQACVSQRWTY